MCTHLPGTRMYPTAPMKRAVGEQPGVKMVGRPGRELTWGLALDYDDPDCWFISACPGPREAHNPHGNAQAYVYRWQGDGPWRALNGGLPQPLKSFPYALASAPGKLYVGLANGTIYTSQDRGESWQQLALHGDTLPSVLAMTV